MKQSLMNKTILQIALLTGLIAGSHAASVIQVTGVETSGFGNYSGDQTKMTDLSGMNGNGTDGPGQSGDPNTWTATSTAYQAEWQSAGNNNGVLYTPNSHNNKMGWIVFDLGSSQAMGEIHLWNVRNGTTTQTRNYNIYFADAAVGVPTNDAVQDYSFTGANGWSQFSSTFTMAATQGNGNGAEDIHNVNGNSARYIGIEIITNNGNYTPNDGNQTATGRVGLAEFAVTAAIPEPSVALLSGLGVLMLLRRKKH